MANLKNKKSNVAKKTAATTTPVQASQTASSQTVEKKTPAKVEEKAAAAAPEKETAASPKIADKTTAEKTATAAAKTAEAKKAPAKKTPAKKTTAKRATRKTTKKAEPIQEVFYEYAGEQILTEELVGRIKEQYKSEGHRVGAIKSLRVYINPEHRKAYYVINDKAEGSFIEF